MSGVNAPFRCSDGLFEHAWFVEDADKDIKVTSVETCAVCHGQRFTYVLNGMVRLKYGRPPKRKVKA